MTGFLKWLSVAALLLVLTVPQLQLVEAGGGPETKLEGRLSGTSLASGKAKFEERADRVRFSVQVEDMSSDGNFTVAVNGAEVSTITVAGGLGDLNLDTRDGESVPSLKAGDDVEVSSGGVVILFGDLSPA